MWRIYSLQMLKATTNFTTISLQIDVTMNVISTRIFTHKFSHQQWGESTCLLKDSLCLSCSLHANVCALEHNKT